MTADCEYCAAARATPACGLYCATCRGCQARAMANSPGYAASVAAGKFRDDYTAALKAIVGDDPAELDRLHKAVRAWDKRIRSAS